MFEYSKTLQKIEKLLEQLPYRSVEIQIEFASGETASLRKEKQIPIGFCVDQSK